ncbi:predicted protein [Nematostella vectensis]|uniref:Peptidase M12B propeptide domain-containing protein n=1 Tax=Nematostella vectensis TaxID=45351 RepID=A7SIU8_NEMVE|nr:predicted protein [Nematostella vectensis]|eukprot:XP_001628427.1 predicted protein [Nematostella vectensis]
MSTVLTVHHHMTSRELQKYFGVDQHKDVPEYDVTHPYQSTSAGTFLSYDLHSDHRSRRSTDIHDKRYNIRAFGKNMHLKLRENKRLLAPGLKVEEYQNGHVRRSELPMGTKHYIGEIEGDAKSIVALSYNDGLTGMIQTRDEPLFVRPIPRHLAAQVGHPTHATPHIVYRRAAKHLDSFEIDRGLAQMSAICVGAIAPSMSNDIGLQTAMIIAHELGHGLGKNLSLLNDIQLTVETAPDIIAETKIHENICLNLHIPGIRRHDLDVSGDGIESCWIELDRRKQKNVLIGCIYRYPRHENRELFYDNLRSEFSDLTGKGREVLVIGDTNQNFLRQTN